MMAYHARVAWRLIYDWVMVVRYQEDYSSSRQRTCVVLRKQLVRRLVLGFLPSDDMSLQRHLVYHHGIKNLDLL